MFRNGQDEFSYSLQIGDIESAGANKKFYYFLSRRSLSGWPKKSPDEILARGGMTLAPDSGWKSGLESSGVALSFRVEAIPEN